MIKSQTQKLKKNDLALDLQYQIGNQASKIFVLTVKNCTVSNFTFQLEPFIEHLIVSDGFEN